MVKHPGAGRVHRESTEPDDALIARALQSAVWARSHRTALTIAGFVLLLIAGSVVYYSNYRRSLAERAAAELVQVRQTAISGNRALAIRDLQAYLRHFGNTPSSGEARLLLGQQYLEGGQPDSARQAVEPLARRGGPHRTTARFLIASAQEAQGALDAAEETYLQIAEDAEWLFQKREALEAAGRLRLQRGDAAAAVEVYERLRSMLPEDDPERSLVEVRLGEARAAARS